MARYTQSQFKMELDSIKSLTQSTDVAAVGAAAARGESLLRSAGGIGSIVTGNNEVELRRAVGLCRAQLAALTAPR